MVNSGGRALICRGINQQIIAANTKVIRTVARSLTALDEALFVELCSSCKACERQCPQQALVIKDNQQPQLDHRRCDGCGLCRGSCYIGAVTLSLIE